MDKGGNAEDGDASYEAGIATTIISIVTTISINVVIMITINDDCSPAI